MNTAKTKHSSLDRRISVAPMMDWPDEIRIRKRNQSVTTVAETRVDQYRTSYGPNIQVLTLSANPDTTESGACKTCGRNFSKVGLYVTEKSPE
ncbi:MAG: hypothetical protein V3S70_00670 [Gammaproteobacteria bacterium]